MNEKMKTALEMLVALLAILAVSIVFALIAIELSKKPPCGLPQNGPWLVSGSCGTVIQSEYDDIRIEKARNAAWSVDSDEIFVVYEIHTGYFGPNSGSNAVTQKLHR